LFEVMMTMGRGARRHGLAGLVDEEFHPVEFLQQVVGELDIRLVDLVDQQDGFAVGLEGLPQLAALDVIGHVVDALLAQLAVAQPADGIVFVKPLLRAGRRLDVPFDDRQAQRLPATWRASSVLPVPGSPFTRSGRSSVTAAFTAMVRSSVAT
jgi:hypothetical protein